MTLDDNVFFENTASVAAGAIDCYDQGSGQVQITRNTICVNTASNLGGAIRCNGPVIIRDSILWGNNAPNGTEIYLSAGSANTMLAIEYSDVQGGQALVSVQPGTTLIWGNGMMNQTPLFTNAASGDFRVLNNSPCIDAGDPASNPCLDRDIQDNPRLLDGLLDGAMRVDMGAHEFDHVHLAITGTATPGGTLTINTTGTDGMLVFLAVAGAPGGVCSTFGALFLDPTQIWVTDFWGTIPSPPVSVTVPPLVTPVDVVFQELALDPLAAAGNTSNAVEITM